MMHMDYREVIKMGNATKSEGFAHVQRFVREVYADRLRQAGFSSYRGEDIHWFRLVNNEVIHAVYFRSSCSRFPLMLEMGYGCHPLFIPPLLKRSPFMAPILSYEQIDYAIPELIPGSTPMGMQHSFIHGLRNNIYRMPDVMVHCPIDEETRQMILDKVLSLLDPIDTPAACYALHKDRREGEIENDAWLTMTPYFVDEVLYWEDKALYPYCSLYIEGKREWLETVKQEGKLKRKVDQEELAQLNVLHDVFLSKNREQYVQQLSEKARKNLAQLKKFVAL